MATIRMLWQLCLAFLLMHGRAYAEDPTMDEEAVVTTVNEDLAALRSIPGFENHDALPTPAELLEMLDKIPGLTDDQRQSMREGLMNKIQSDQGGNGGTPMKDGSSPFLMQTATLLALISIIAWIIVFFGYKLYKSLSERERKREEKRKMKQMKKKK